MKLFESLKLSAEHKRIIRSLSPDRKAAVEKAIKTARTSGSCLVEVAGGYAHADKRPRDPKIYWNLCDGEKVIAEGTVL